MKSANRGFTLIEAMVASVLVAVGVASAIQGYSALTRAQSQVQERDRMQRLAVSKYDEILATGISNAAASGDFQDYSETRYKWASDIANTTTTGLQSIKITVTAVDPSDATQVSVDGLAYDPTTTTGTTGAGG
jgi:prepilin-type N-terminal cleavage/methylation domain-containing protein